MPEVADRDKKETELADSLWGVWLSWSDVSSPTSLSSRFLLPMIRKATTDQIGHIWYTGYRTVLQQFEARESARRAANLFTTWFAWWEQSITDWWSERVRDFISRRQEVPEQTPTWDHVRGRGRPIVEVDDSGQLPTIPPIEDRFGVPIGAEPLIRPWELTRESIDVVTDSNTSGELSAVRDVHRQGLGRIESIWRTEPGACKKCEPLEGQPRRVWIQVAPRGPRLHFNCRCYLQHYRIGF